jgi:hypothetical protein
VQADAEALVLEQQALVAARQVAQHVAGMVEVGMRLDAVDAVHPAPHQAMDGGDEPHPVFQDAVDVFQRAAADDGQPAVQRPRQIVEQRRARVGPHLFGAGHDRGQGSVKIEKQRRARRQGGWWWRQIARRMPND